MKVEREETNRVISCECKIRLVVKVYCVAVGAVDDVLDAPAVGHQGLMVAVVGWEEDALALRIVGCDEPSDIRESFTREFGEGAGGCVDVVCVGHCELVEGLIDGVRGLVPDTFIAQGSSILTIGTSLSGVRGVPELRSLIDSCMGQSITWMLGGGYGQFRAYRTRFSRSRSSHDFPPLSLSLIVYCIFSPLRSLTLNVESFLHPPSSILRSFSDAEASELSLYSYMGAVH